MTTQFDRELYGFRFAETFRGDSLQTIAARELGDASRWTELISYNKLAPPFITDDKNAAGPGVLLTGAQLLVPAPAPVVSSTIDPDLVFESDIRLGADGEVATSGGDFDIVSGAPNLVQALQNVIKTDKGDLIYHPEYGADIRRLIGVTNGPTASLIAARYAKSAIEADARINKVDLSQAVASGDVLNVTVEAEAVSGRKIEITAAP